jgi:hypothetical protein
MTGQLITLPTRMVSIYLMIPQLTLQRPTRRVPLDLTISGRALTAFTPSMTKTKISK